MTLYLARLFPFPPSRIEEFRAGFREALSGFSRDLVLVSDEVGLGPVPENAETRLFREALGIANQAAAAAADSVFWVTAGIATRIK